MQENGSCLNSIARSPVEQKLTFQPYELTVCYQIECIRREGYPSKHGEEARSLL